MVEFILSNSSVFFARVNLVWLYFDQSKAMCALQCLLIDKNLILLGIIKFTVLLIQTCVACTWQAANKRVVKEMSGGGCSS